MLARTPAHAPTARIPTVRERVARADADRALNTASDLMVGMLIAREGMGDTAAHAADLRDRTDALITQMQIARARLNDRAGF